MPSPPPRAASVPAWARSMEFARTLPRDDRVAAGRPRRPSMSRPSQAVPSAWFASHFSPLHYPRFLRRFVVRNRQEMNVIEGANSYPASAFRAALKAPFALGVCRYVLSRTHAFSFGRRNELDPSPTIGSLTLSNVRKHCVQVVVELRRPLLAVFANFLNDRVFVHVHSPASSDASPISSSGVQTIGNT